MYFFIISSTDDHTFFIVAKENSPTDQKNFERIRQIVIEDILQTTVVLNLECTLESLKKLPVPGLHSRSLTSESVEGWALGGQFKALS